LQLQRYNNLMNSYEAKKLNLPELMLRLGYEPTAIKKGGNEYWYNSPFRQEKDASFHTSFLGGKWIWNDFGDKGGTVIDFVMRHENYVSVSQALSFLDDMYSKGYKSSFSFQQQAFKNFSPGAEVESERELEFLSAKPISNPLIVSYLTKERGLDKTVILKYLQEVKYKNLNNQKEYFAFGMVNQSDGYEIRVASDKYPFKSALKAKDITFIEGLKNNGRSINVFEGMTDFLSLLTMKHTNNFSGDSLILHSTQLLDRAVDFIKQRNYDVINGFLDNDKSGREGTANLEAEFGGKVCPQNDLYQGYKDINAYLKGTTASMN